MKELNDIEKEKMKKADITYKIGCLLLILGFLIFVATTFIIKSFCLQLISFIIICIGIIIISFASNEIHDVIFIHTASIDEIKKLRK